MKKLILFLLISITPLYSENFFDVKDFDFERRMDFFNIPGVSISIISEKEVVWNGTFGDDIDTDTLFQAANISKFITSVGLFKLIESGQVELDRDINNYLTSWTLEDNIYTRNRKVTLRMLLSHTSGIQESGLKGYNESENLPLLENTIKPLRFFPGLKRRYSWSGYSIIQKVIEDVTGLSFNEYITTEVLEPLNMKRSSFNIEFLEDENNITKGHDLFGKEIEGGWRVYPELAASGLWSTPNDISKIIIELQKILTEEYEGLLTKESVESMFSYQIGGWGLGPSLKFNDEDLIFRHSGESSGYISYFVGKAYKGDSVVIMCNGENSWKLIMEFIHSFKNYKSWGI